MTLSTFFPYTTLFRSSTAEHRGQRVPARRMHRLDSRLAGTGLQQGMQRQQRFPRSEEHTSELQSPCNLVCRLLLEKKNRKYIEATILCIEDVAFGRKG